MRQDIIDANAEEGLVPTGNDYIAADGNVVVNQWGCYGQTDNPHYSVHGGVPVVDVHARTACPNDTVSYLWVETELHREYNCIFSTCFGIEPWGPVASKSAENKRSVEVYSEGPCLHTTYYKGISAHSMIGPDDNQYIAFTSKRAKVTVSFVDNQFQPMRIASPSFTQLSLSQK